MTDANDRTPATGKDPTDRQQAHQDLQEDARSVLSPAVDDLVASLITPADPAEAYTWYLLKAAEFAELAMDRLDHADALGLPSTQLNLLRHARETLYYSAKIAHGSDPERAREFLGKDITRLVETYEALDTEHEVPSIDEGAIPESHPDDTQWMKHSNRGRASVRGPLMGTEIDGTDDDVEARIELLPLTRDHVPIALGIEADTDPGEASISIMADLTPDQAESLAAALCEQAEEAREYNDAE